ncbi:hypothetical protein D9M69_612030 [compost metagenome]
MECGHDITEGSKGIDARSHHFTCYLHFDHFEPGDGNPDPGISGSYSTVSFRQGRFDFFCGRNHIQASYRNHTAFFQYDVTVGIDPGRLGILGKAVNHYLELIAGP